MKSLLTGILLPLAIVTMTAAGPFSSKGRIDSPLSFSTQPIASPDTVTYDIYGYRKGWTAEDYKIKGGEIADSLLQAGDDSLIFDTTTFFDDYTDDSLSIDSASVNLPAAIDSAAIHDSIRIADSLAQVAFQAWYDSLDNRAKRRYHKELRLEAEAIIRDSLDEVKLREQEIKDSTRNATPRILDTYFLSDSMHYVRTVSWVHDREFHNLKDVKDQDVLDDLNYRFNDYPFLKEDVNATWLGMAGSPVQYYNFFNRKSREKVSFYEAQESWSYSPETLPAFNTKVPYTELAYWGSLLSGDQKASDNIHILTTQNITPEFNFTLSYDRFGGNGMLHNEQTKNKTFTASADYLGKRYLMHAGYIYNMVFRKENGGIVDNYWIRDTTVDSREVDVTLANANSTIKKNTIFLDQQYRIPLFFLLPKSDEEGEVTFYEDEIPTAFIGHSSEFSVYSRKYTDIISSDIERDFYNNVFNYNPDASYDSLGVRKFDNKFFIRLQPWAKDAIVSNLDVGIGENIMNYAEFDPSYLRESKGYNWHSTYAYASVNGKLKQYIEWDALGHYSFIGDDAGDFDLSANAKFQFYPFRRERTSPVVLNFHFDTSLDEPEYYQQHLYTNHFSWDNDFSKISTSRFQAEIAIPRWQSRLSAGYALLTNNIYYGTDGIIRQNEKPMSVASIELDQNFVLGKLHLDHRALLQVSSNEEVMPLPLVALNARYYIQFNIKKDIMKMQLGVNTLYNSSWYAPAWNPAIGVFHNQTERKYGNAPYFDIFANIQWKRACIFIKYENAGMGWPMDEADYFSADRYIRTQRTVKMGIFWPFFTQPLKSNQNNSAQ